MTKQKTTIAQIYDCAVLWRSDDADHPNTPPLAWQKVLPLMEAAPEMLEALKIALQYLVYPASHPAVKAVKEAIAKAERQP